MPQYCRVLPSNWGIRRPTYTMLNPKIREALPYLLGLTAMVFAYNLGRFVERSSHVLPSNPLGVCGAMVDSISQTCDVVQFPLEFFDITSDYLGPGVMTASDKFLSERYLRRKAEEEKIRIFLQALSARIAAQRTYYLEAFHTYIQTNYISLIYYTILHITVAIVIQSYPLRKLPRQPQTVFLPPVQMLARDTVARNDPVVVHVRATNVLTHQDEPKATALETRVEALEKRLEEFETRNVRRGSPSRISRSPSPMEMESEDESEAVPSGSATPEL
ncbi:hypothetical protein SISSUDRAFT_1049683 [Sistotremastrum suecicum HHB10207 ss-3]|uniref:Uncharacterized protein n=1 Tax=Sistotremastrum suecicum HHB10207 ss-3 TaxID=1314776 RepID=A0A166BMJ1_9AGAM|nr:hypothetical protein SISSUDRAFT_1049683 [Sistotremastrum suecicum HHB10207 ss-3]